MYDLLPWFGSAGAIGAINTEGNQADVTIYPSNASLYLLRYAGAGMSRGTYGALSGTYTSVELLHAGASHGVLSGVVGGDLSKITQPGYQPDNPLSVLDDNDTLVGGAGADFLIGGYSLGDTFTGNGGGDTFAVFLKATKGTTVARFVFTGASDSVDVVDFSSGFSEAYTGGPEVLDLTGCTFQNIETLNFDYPQAINLNASQFGSGKLSLAATIEILGHNPSLTIDMTDSNRLDLRGLSINPSQTDTRMQTVRIDGTAAGDTIHGTQTAHLLIDELRGHDGNDKLFGHSGQDRLYGDAGADFLDGGTDLGMGDWLAGGAGNDTYVVDSTSDRVIERDASRSTGGEDLVMASASYTLGLNIERLMLAGSAVSGTGNDSANVITGTAVRNILSGRAGNDKLEGLAGDDRLDGGLGSDQMIGGAGNDTYFVDVKGDRIFERADEGSDWVKTFVDYTLGSNVEALALMTGAKNGAGNSLDNTIVGNVTNNHLKGLEGNDTLFGGEGSDTLDGGAGNDVLKGETSPDLLIGGLGRDVFEFDGSGVDRVTDFTQGTDKLALRSFPFTELHRGQLTESAFVTGEAARDTDDRIIYSATTGLLYYDADGSGTRALAWAFAVLDNKATLSASDFIIA